VSTAFDELLAAIWRGHDPYAGFDEAAHAPDRQGWNSRHPYLADAVATLRPRIIVEVGVWKGGSVLTMADALRDHGVDGCIVAVDTWLGSVEHWRARQFPDNLAIRHGQPGLMGIFMGNVIRAGHARRVIPLPLDSVNASALLRACRVAPDLLHIDAGHDQRSVVADLEQWWPMLKPGGMLIGDDYNPAPSPHWAEVRQGFDEVFGRLGLTPLENAAGKCRVSKPLA